MKAVSAPISMSPASTRIAPNHNTAIEETLRTSTTTGNMAAIHRPTVTETSVSSSLARRNRAVS